MLLVDEPQSVCAGGRSYCPFMQHSPAVGPDPAMLGAKCWRMLRSRVRAASRLCPLASPWSRFSLPCCNVPGELPPRRRKAPASLCSVTALDRRQPFNALLPAPRPRRKAASWAAGRKRIPSGWPIGERAWSEADVGDNYLFAHGAPARRIRRGDRSPSTDENRQRYRTSLVPAVTEPAIAITNRLHLARMGVLARGLGSPHRLCAAEDSPWFCRPMLGEAFLINWYLAGRKCARWIRTTPMPTRIS
jgi:hypothetical protein